MSHYYSQEHQIILDFYKDKILQMFWQIFWRGKTMKNYDLIIIGFGKAGKTLAALLVTDKKVAVVEQSTKMYGGTCINI